MQDIVNHFNTHFTTIGERYVTNNTQYQANKLNDYVQDKIPAGVRFTFPFIKLDETKKLLSKLETSKATGLDEVGPFFIKLSSEALAPSITYLINLSLEGVFPENLKLAKVNPILKNEANHTAIDMYADDTTLHTYETNEEEIERKLITMPTP
ncbi:Hypothetical predicted protein [Mytilus galloprovincialis]|uniref:Uncharacterized protein n=1 Tax=Mytilus galloprovincialis TaxID=29158 RepID=A0A8B6FSN3_MYTGA|nr:Hypothetical predicted protein [Mytilus galloprovincialis]